jgi:hypothetical protein
VTFGTVCGAVALDGGWLAGGLAGGAAGGLIVVVTVGAAVAPAFRTTVVPHAVIPSAPATARVVMTSFIAHLLLPGMSPDT